MTENDIIVKLQTLKAIKPKNEWVVFTKSQILKEEKSNFAVREFWQVLRFAFGHKYAFASLSVLAVLIGTFGFSLKSDPGDMLFSVKKVVEEGQMAFMSEEQKVKFNLDKANQQMDDLTKAAQEKDENKIAPALNEYKASISAVAQNLVNETDKTKIKETVAKVKELENKEGLAQSLGVVLGENPEKDLALVKLITDQVKELEAMENLSSENKRNIYQIKDLCEKGYFTEALDLILLVNNTK